MSKSTTASSTYYPPSVVDDPYGRVLFSPYERTSHGTWFWVQVGRKTDRQTNISEKLDHLRSLRKRVDELPARCTALRAIDEAPNAESMKHANVVLDASIGFHLEPDRVVASAEGGVSVVFIQDHTRASIECFNTGEMVASIVPKGEEPVVWDVNPDSVYAALSQICERFAS